MDYSTLPSPTDSSATSPRSTKRSSTQTPQDEFDDSPQPKKRASRSTASEKAAKKSARMERNRIAAQASRDRKKNHTDFLESRISELEQQLAASTSSSSSSFPLPTPPTTRLDQLPLPPLVDSEVTQLREENASLRTQLELEKMESKGLQLRLASLEGKFGRLEQLFEKLGNTKEEEVTTAIAELVPLTFPPTSPSSSTNFDFSLPDFTSDSLFDSNPTSLDNSFTFDAPLLDPSIVDQAWEDWSSIQQPINLDVDPLVKQEDSTFDLFEFLSREISTAGQAEIMC
ncbi:hypothetical protein JCM5353_001738 [Sporobolomyces roseus]